MCIHKITKNQSYWIDEVSIVEVAAGELVWQELADVVQNETADANCVRALVQVAAHEAKSKRNTNK